MQESLRTKPESPKTVFELLVRKVSSVYESLGVVILEAILAVDQKRRMQNVSLGMFHFVEPETVCEMEGNFLQGLMVQRKDCLGLGMRVNEQLDLGGDG